MSSLRCTYSGGGDYHYFKGGEALNVHSLYVHGHTDKYQDYYPIENFNTQHFEHIQKNTQNCSLLRGNGLLFTLKNSYVLVNGVKLKKN